MARHAENETTVPLPWGARRAPQAAQHAPPRLELVGQDGALRALGLAPRGRRARAQRLLARVRGQARAQVRRGRQRVALQAALQRLQLPGARRAQRLADSDRGRVEYLDQARPVLTSRALS